MNLVSCGKLKSLKRFNLFRSIKSHTGIGSCSNLTTRNPDSDLFSLPEKFAVYLENCTDASSVKKLHACVITQGLEHDLFLVSKLLVSFAKFNLSTEYKWVFTEINGNNLSLWNSVVEYFRAHGHSEILGLYLNSRREQIKIPGLAINFALKSCQEFGSFEFGRNLHTDAFKFGLNCNRFVGSSLIGFYSKYDQVTEAAKVFDEMIDRDTITYTSMITGYAQAGSGHGINNAFTIAYDMQREGFQPNRVTLVSLLQCASRVGASVEGRSVHGYAIRKDIGCLDEIFETSLMHMYMKCGHPDRGLLVFDNMRKKDAGSWNALVACHLEVGRPLEAFNIFLQMVDKCEFDLIGLVNGLRICAELGYLLMGRSIHCQILQRGVCLDLIGTTSLIVMYSKCNHLSAAIKIFYGAETKDDALYNAIIAGCLCHRCFYRAIEIFGEMASFCVKLNTGTIINILSAFSEMGDSRTGKCVHGFVFRQGLETNVDMCNQFIDMYAKCGFIGHARKVFLGMKLKDRVSWTSMMTGLVNQGLADEVITLLALMQRENTLADAVTFTCLLQALNQLGSMLLVKELHGHLYRIFLEKDTALMNSLLTTYSKWGNLEFAINLFERMPEKNLSSWNTMIAAYGMHGESVQALKLFDQMKHARIPPDGTTFKSILSACSHAGLVEDGWQAFTSMQKEHGIIPTDEHYCCMVDLLGRAGRVEEAYELVKHAPSQQNDSALAALLAACISHGDSEMGEKVGKQLLSGSPGNTSAYCSISNLYGGVGRWDEVARVGGLAKRKGVKRIPGYSLVGLN